jgi:hypothetical protein
VVAPGQNRNRFSGQKIDIRVNPICDVKVGSNALLEGACASSFAAAPLAEQIAKNLCKNPGVALRLPQRATTFV